jgi:hypothetical protein
MKKYSSLKAFIIPLVIILSFCIIRPGINKEAGPSLTPEYLASGTWGPENRVGIKVKFTKDKKFEANIDYGQSYSTGKGTYVIKGGKITLTIDKIPADKQLEGMELRDGQLSDGILIYDEKSPKYKECLVFKEGESLYRKGEVKIWNYNSLIKKGTAFTIQGKEVTGMGAKEGSTTVIVKVREEPSVNAKEIHYTYEDAMEPPVTVKSLEKGKGLIVLARTKDKDKVGKWNNYWYYVEFETYIDYMRGWVYGEFVQMK